MPEWCACRPPGKIAPEGMCPRCDHEGSRHQAALREALAAGNWKPAADEAARLAMAEGFRLGLREGRRQAIQSLLGDPASARRPAFGPGLDSIAAQSESDSASWEEI